MNDQSDKELLDALGVQATPEKKAVRTPREERIIAGFEEIQRFYEQHGRAPEHGEDKEIFERIYAVRLDQLRKLEECRNVLAGIDHQGLLELSSGNEEITPEELDDKDLLSQLGVSANSAEDITQLRHVKPRQEIRTAEEIANRKRCDDFHKFKPIFDAVQKELDGGARQTLPFKDNASVKKSDLFILSGQKVYVADVGEEFYSESQNRSDARIRAIYDNGTESDLLKTSLQRALQKDERGRRISNPSAGPLFSGVSDSEDLASGTIYVLRSKSDHPTICENRQIIHKIGVTGGDIKQRLANAKNDPTFLMADVEVIAKYELFNINRTKLEKLIHKFFESAQLDIQIIDRFGKPVVPREWYLVPISAIDDTVSRIKDGTIGEFLYDVGTASIKARFT